MLALVLRRRRHTDPRPHNIPPRQPPCPPHQHPLLRPNHSPRRPRLLGITRLRQLCLPLPIRRLYPDAQGLVARRRPLHLMALGHR